MNSGFVSLARVIRGGLVPLLVITAACGDGGTNPSGPRAIARVSADSQTTAAGVKMAQPLVVVVTGSGGSPFQGATVNWSIGNGGGSLSDTVTTTDAAGHAQTTYTPGTTPGTARVTATVAGGPNLFFTLTLVAGPPTELRKFGFDNPAVVAGTVLTLSVKLVDAVGNGISGKTVNWAPNGGSVGAGTSTTDSGGVASVTYTTGSTAGNYSLTATVEGIPPTTFNIRAI